MKQVFWLIEGQLAGRSGPNKDAWDLAELKHYQVPCFFVSQMV